ncbi:MAG TPA: maltose alpha-D-glucosyltransferase [Terracidiphilus sp.]|nr:maltose alpha-D-glucosyltransferase [Terracidiphilus sp.]
MKKLASAIDPLWYKDAIIYEVHVRAFADSNNDGIGDFPGLVSRLDYLQDLGVTCIWLLPFFPSPLRDDGYDISNYTDVNPSYGTLNDFKSFLDAAHQRNMQVMIELVINHTSDQHPWFKAARLAPAGSPEREMYVWSDTDRRYKDARIIFTDTEKSNWTWDETAKAFYWHRFFSHQPDLNFDNPRVVEEVLKAMRFWLDMGVDALRMDAIPYLCERDETSCENLPETHAVVKLIRAAIDADYANRLILAEANQWPADVRPYFGDGDECHMAFHFPLMPRIYMALRQEDRLPITDIMAQTPAIPDNCQWGLFLRNHDELTLEMVTDDERDYMYFAYSADPRMRVNVGIRRRLAPLVDNNRRRIELLNSILLSFPGTPILYYGDEIGMGDNIYLGDRNGVRTPMQWTSDRNAGFSKCDPARLYLPVVMDYIYGYQVVNVEAQLSDQSSLLHWTRNMIALRKLFQVFGRGTLTFLNPANRRILAYLRALDRGDGTQETVLCVANLSRFAQPVSLDLSNYAGMEPVEMIGYVPFPLITAAPYSLTLAPYSFLWLELQAPQVELQTTTMGREQVQRELSVGESVGVDALAKGWTGFLAGRGTAAIEAALPAWLPKQRWFGAKTRKVQSVRIWNWVELQTGAERHRFDTPDVTRSNPALFFVEVAYVEGTPDHYQIPLAVRVGREGEDVVQNYPASIVITLNSVSGPVVVHDVSPYEDFHQELLKLIESNATLALADGHIIAHEAVAVTRATVNIETADFQSGDAAPADAAASSLTSSQDTSGSQDGSGPNPPGPVSLTAQPGEAAAPPRSSAPAPSAGAQRLQPRESPTAGDPAPIGGRMDARASAAFVRERSPQRLTSRVGSAEQSNTSILYGSKYILKLFRRLQPGENPDVEIGRFLTEVAHFPRIAPFLGEISITPIDGEKTTVAMMQGLVANQGDGWEWFLNQLVSGLEQAVRLPRSKEYPTPRLLDDLPPLPEALALARESLEAAALLGQRTAEMHLALAMPTENPAFSPEPTTKEDVARDAERIVTQLSAAFDALRSQLSTLDEASADAGALLLSRRVELMQRARAIASLTVAGQRIRIHGDFHLGQTLRTRERSAKAGTAQNTEGGDFVFLDFEGEPARSLAERRRKQSSLKDVAGMMRSFSYAAHSALNRFISEHPDGVDAEALGTIRAWAGACENAASARFLHTYRETIAQNPALLGPLDQSQDLLNAYLLEKALYELLYELNNRPAWLTIPISGILAL